MKVTRSILVRVPVLLAASALLSLAPASADTYSGKIRFNGKIQNDAKPGSLSFVYTGEISNKAGDRATVSGGGLFRTTTSAIDNTTFTGDLTSYVRYSASLGKPTKLIKKVTPTTVSVRGKIIRFPGAVIRLRTPVDGSTDALQRIKGTGTLKVRR